MLKLNMLSCMVNASSLVGRVGVDVSKHSYYLSLTIFYLLSSMLVVATSGTGYVLGSGSAIDFPGLCLTCIGTMMVAASANSLNQVPF